jgi:two-component system heavy metal sensor histidine kinase CusS
VSRLNDLLGRLEAAFDREKCFTADAAHELRTPLAGIQTALEVCASQPRDVPHYRQVVQSCLKTARQMHGLIDNLLLLARADADRVAVSSEPVDVAQLIRDAWVHFQPIARQRGLHVEMSLSDAVIDTDRDKLEIIVNNLLANAVQYTDDGGRVGITVTPSNGSLQMQVANTGAPLPPEHCEKVFDRFWRGDVARSSNGGHYGLGLAVCRKLAEAMGVRLTAHALPEGVFVVNLGLPAASVTRPSIQ